MKKDSQSDNKHILKDPIAAFHTQFPDGDAQLLKTIESHWAEFRDHKKQLKAFHNKTGKISRKIGEAKKQGIPIESLLSQMRENSAKVKNISQTMHETGEKITHIFHSHQETQQSKKQKDNQSEIVTKWKGRNYPLAKANVSLAKRSDWPNGDNSINIDQLTAKDEEAWNRYADNNPAASLYHQVAWRKIIRDSFGHEGLYFLAKATDGTVKGILPLIRLQSRLFGDFLVSMPYFNYGGAVADSPAIEQKLMEAANKEAERLGVSHCEYRDDIPREGFPSRTDKVNMILSLPDNTDGLWQGFSPKLRAQIKRPQREKPQILCGREELLDDFYRVFSHNMRDLGTPVYSKSFFHNILQTFPSNSHIMVIRLNNQPVATGFLLGHGTTLEIPWASTLRKTNHLSINMLLYWEVLRFAIKHSYQYFDFGRSSKDSGTLKFKRQWGALPKQLYWHYWLDNNSEMPSLNPSNPKFALMIAIWKRLPIKITQWIGPMIVKNLP